MMAFSYQPSAVSLQLIAFKKLTSAKSQAQENYRLPLGDSKRGKNAGAGAHLCHRKYD